MIIKVAFYSVKNTKLFKLQKLLSKLEVPFAFTYLKSYIDKYLPGVAEFEIIDNINKLTSDNFNILGLSSYSYSFSEVQDIAKRAKKINPEIFIVLGSYHITALPYSLPLSVDCGVIGEGEETFKEIIELVKAYGTTNAKENLKKIKGIVYKENGNLTLTEKREPFDNLDKIPIPDRNIIKDDNQLAIIKRSLFSNRGCPYNCNFCAGSVLWGNAKCIYFSPQYVILEIEHILNTYPDVNSLGFMDGLFVANKARLYEMVKAIEEKGFNKYMDFVVTVRANLINDEICTLLKRMNVSSVFIGFESASLKILKHFNKKTTPQDNQATLDLLYNYNIKTNCNFIFGTPTETVEDMYSTFDFIINNKTAGKIDLINIFALTPFPGTYYWDYAKEKGLVHENMDFGKFSEMALPKTTIMCSFDEWRKFREGYGVYLNSDFINESKFYDLLNQFFNELIRVYSLEQV